MSGIVKASKTTAAGARDRRFGPRPRARTLTRRERQVVELVATGASDDEIAEQLGIARRTACAARERAAARLGVAGLGLRVDVMLTRYAIREGLVSLW